MPQMTRAKILKWVKENGNGAGLYIEKEGRHWSIYFDAPKGFIWNESGCHVSCAIHGQDFTTAPDWNKLFADVKRILEDGTEQCEEKDCEICHPDVPLDPQYFRNTEPVVKQ